MKTFIVIGVFVTLAAMTIASSSTSATKKPFVRSRYSKRWRLAETTETSVVNNTLTTEPQKVMVVNALIPESTTVSNVADVVDTTTPGEATIRSSTTSLIPKSAQKPKKGGYSTTTEHPRHPGANGLPLDYDYYGNGGENEDEAGHK